MKLFSSFAAAVLAASTVVAVDRGGPSHPYVGLWTTADGHIRHRLLPDGRYDEARGDRESAYRGSYVIDGNRITYRDDTGFTADGVFVDDDVLHHAGMVLTRTGP